MSLFPNTCTWLICAHHPPQLFLARGERVIIPHETQPLPMMLANSDIGDSESGIGWCTTLPMPHAQVTPRSRPGHRYSPRIHPCGASPSSSLRFLRPTPSQARSAAVTYRGTAISPPSLALSGPGYITVFCSYSKSNPSPNHSFFFGGGGCEEKVLSNLLCDGSSNRHRD